MNALRFFGAALLCVGAVSASAAERVVDRSTMQRLSALRGADSLDLDAFPTGPTHSGVVTFRRAQVYAPDAHLYVINGTDKQEIPRSARIYLRGGAGG